MHCSRVDAFRHRANAIMVERAERGHTELWLTLTNLRAISKSMPSDLTGDGGPVLPDKRLRLSRDRAQTIAAKAHAGRQRSSATDYARY